MTTIQAVLLGLVQGITEFLPVSSSGHLILAREALNLQVPEGLAVDATLQLATVLAVIVYFRKDLLRIAQSALSMFRGESVEQHNKTLVLALIIGTVPAVLAGLYLEDTMDTVFRNAELVAFVLIAGAVFFTIAEYVYRHIETKKDLSVERGFVVGLFQVLALVPGMSRSGATIAGGMMLGLSRESAARFSFLLSVPIILGSGAKKLLELGSAGTPGNEWVMIGVSAVVAFCSGLLAIHFLLSFLKKHSLHIFAIYRIALAVIVLFFGGV